MGDKGKKNKSKLQKKRRTTSTHKLARDVVGYATVSRVVDIAKK